MFLLNIIREKDSTLFSNFSFVCIGIILIYILTNFFLPRKNTLPESYPLQNAVLLITRYDDFLDFMLEYFKKVSIERGWKTWRVTAPFLPSFVLSNDVANISHVLNKNFENYGKGPAMKWRFQGLLGDGIFNVDGEKWYKHRKTSAHLFSMNKFKGMVLATLNDNVNKVIDIINQQNGKEFNIQALLFKFTLDSIGIIAFGHNIGALTMERVQFADDFDFAQEMTNHSFLDPLWWFRLHFTEKGRKLKDGLKRIDEYAYGIVKKRREEDELRKKGGDTASFEQAATHNDLLGLYLSRQDTSDPSSILSDADLRDIILNFFIAGRDTTAQAMSWSIYRLCVHREVQTRIRDEIVEVFGKDWPQDSAITHEHLNKMNYLEAFCMEVLRFHPSVPKEAKYVYHDDVLPDGTQVYEG